MHVDAVILRLQLDEACESIARQARTIREQAAEIERLRSEREVQDAAMKGAEIIPDVQVFAHLVEQAAYERAAKRPEIEVILAAKHGYWSVAICIGHQRFALAASFETLKEADEYADVVRGALGSKT